MRLVTAIAASLALFGASAAHAQVFQNGGFQDGFVGWDRTDPMVINTVIESNHFADPLVNSMLDASYLPQEGWQFAQLTADAANVPVILGQNFEVSSETFLTGFVAFLGNDAIALPGNPFAPPGSLNDYGFVRLITFDPLAMGPPVVLSMSDLYRRDIAGVGDNRATPWETFNASVGPGRYRIEFGVVNDYDGFGLSRLLVDGISVTAVPEPATWAMLLTGFLGMGVMLRRYRSAHA